VPAEPDVHHYLSTACMHGLCDKRCRSSCKYCDATCEHDCHPQQGERELPPPWVGQARDIAIELANVFGGWEHVQGDLGDRIRHDPHLFWLRGETQPAGEWKQPQPGNDPNG
jgi:hypothetical protein